jgi:hypothetical protein
LQEGRLQSGVGQPLRVIVPTVGVPAEDLELRCVRLVRPAVSDGIPFPADARIDFEETNSGKRMVVKTRAAVQEPFVRFTIEWLCGASVRRDYTLLLDPVPPADATPAPVSAPITVIPIVSQTATGQESSAGSPGASVPASERSQNSEPRRVRPRSNTGSRESLQRRSIELRDRLAIRGTPQSLARDLDLTVLMSPRLRLSPMITLGGATALSEVDRAVLVNKRDRLLNTPVESDLRPQLEVDLMIAQKRIAELQARITAAEAAGKPAAAVVNASDATLPTPSTAASPAPAVPTVTPAAKPPVSREIAPTGDSFWNWALRWFWLPALLAIGSLIVALFWLKKKRGRIRQYHDGSRGHHR